MLSRLATVNVFLYSWIVLVASGYEPIVLCVQPAVSDPNQFAGTSLIL